MTDDIALKRMTEHSIRLSMDTVLALSGGNFQLLSLLENLASSCIERGISLALYAPEYAAALLAEYDASYAEVVLAAGHEGPPAMTAGERQEAVAEDVRDFPIAFTQEPAQ